MVQVFKQNLVFIAKWHVIIVIAFKVIIYNNMVAFVYKRQKCI